MNQNSDIRRYRLTLLPMGIVVQADRGRTIMEVLTASGIAMRSDCGGKGKCGKCMVSVYPAANLSPLMYTEIRLFEKREVLPGTRLACQAMIQGDITVTLPAWGREGDPILPKSDASGNFTVSPAVNRIIIDGNRWPESFSGNPAGDFYDWIRYE
ncbi:MAG TPA: 2Fe-2S iron-sulfur cluster-binding protein, partial [Desulfatirhabdiaceae bacterium]|nr:2Fe-2S iron-sulfur cluster-binding protein [Desulfatirhabdiaceae bacterium]